MWECRGQLHVASFVVGSYFKHRRSVHRTPRKGQFSSSTSTTAQSHPFPIPFYPIVYQPILPAAAPARPQSCTGRWCPPQSKVAAPTPSRRARRPVPLSLAVGTRLVSVNPRVRGTTAVGRRFVSAYQDGRNTAVQQYTQSQRLEDVTSLTRLNATLTERPGLALSQCTGRITSAVGIVAA